MYYIFLSDGGLMNKNLQLKNYNLIINSIYYNCFIPLLIDSFCEFYGDNYREKIDGTIKEILLARCDFFNLLSHRQQKKCIKRIAFKEQQLLKKIQSVFPEIQNLNTLALSNDQIQSIVSNHSSLSFDDFILLKRYILESAYYKSLYHLTHHHGKEDPLLVGTNFSLEEDSTEIDELVKNLIHKIKPPKTDFAYTFIGIDCISFISTQGYGIPLHALIHEINHLLSRETVILSTDNLNIVTKGISEDPTTDLIYEMINDYMADEVEEIFNKKIKEHSYEYLTYIFQDESSFLGTYPIIDQVSKQTILQFYKSEQDIIKSSLIQGEGRKIYKIVGGNFYHQLNDKYHFIYRELKQDFSNFSLLQNQYSSFFETSQSILEKRVAQYVSYEKDMAKYKKFPK